MSETTFRALQVGDYVSKIWEPGVFYEVVEVDDVAGFDGIVTVRKNNRTWKLPRRHVMRAVPATGGDN